MNHTGNTPLRPSTCTCTIDIRDGKVIDLEAGCPDHTVADLKYPPTAHECQTPTDVAFVAHLPLGYTWTCGCGRQWIWVHVGTPHEFGHWIEAVAKAESVGTNGIHQH